LSDRFEINVDDELFIDNNWIQAKDLKIGDIYKFDLNFINIIDLIY
jgi:hypothetical protein